MSSEVPESIGPYRVLSRLGAGGMGEVLLAYDPRLDRQVAIKRILPEAEGGEEWRARFQREARLAARLAHPAIVQVFDWLAAGEAEHIVMEYLPGRSLRQALTEDGPPEPSRGLEIALAVARGLDYAHRHGVLHRDLKSENVLIGPEGEVKITDFGIARSLASVGEESEDLTAAGAVLGTLRSMSPEQARGQPVDARSDLFSLGVLFYELLTGRSPFRADSPVATLAQVLEHDPPAAGSLDAGIPAELSSLIEHLLEKHPALRPRDAGEVVERLEQLRSGSGSWNDELLGQTTVAGVPEKEATPSVRGPSAGGPSGKLPSWAWPGAVLALAVLAVLAAFLGGRPADGPTPVTVAVLRPELENPAAGEDMLYLALAVRNAATQYLSTLEGVSAIAGQEVDQIRGAPTLVARALAVDEVLSSNLACRGGECEVGLSRLRGEDAGVLWSDHFPVALDDPLGTARAVAGWLEKGFRERLPRQGAQRFEVSPDDFRAYLEIRRSITVQPDPAALVEQLERLATLRRSSERFVDVHLLESEIATRLYLETGDPALLERAVERLESARELAPDDLEVEFRALRVEIQARRFESAEVSLARLEAQVPGDPRLLDYRAQMLELRGDLGEALEVIREGVRRQPSWKRLHDCARLAARIGAAAVASDCRDRMLERSPDQVHVLRLVAWLELVGGDLERAADLSRSLLDEAPDPLSLSILGLAQMLAGRYGEATRAFERASEIVPGSPGILLNLADGHWLQGDREEAEEVYRRILELLEDPPAEPGWQELTIRAQALAHLGERTEAVSTIVQALRAAPEEAQILFEAALVSSLVGDYTTARAYAEQALALGWEARWFTLPWFDELRRRPEGALLAGATEGS